MPRSIAVVVRDGETVESALLRSLREVRKGALRTRVAEGFSPDQSQSAEAEADAPTTRFQDLVGAKHIRGLTPKEKRALTALDAKLDDAAEEFYKPILDRARAELAQKKARVSQRA